MMVISIVIVRLVARAACFAILVVVAIAVVVVGGGGVRVATAAATAVVVVVEVKSGVVYVEGLACFRLDERKTKQAYSK